MKANESKAICVRLPKDLADWVSGMAKSNYRTLSGEVLKMLEEKRNEQSKAA